MIGIAKQKMTMLCISAFFLVISAFAGVFGYLGIANYSWDGAKILFPIFFIFAVLSYLAARYRKTPA